MLSSEDRCVKEKRLALKGDVPGKFRLPKDFGKELLETSLLTTARLCRGLGGAQQVGSSHRALPVSQIHTDTWSGPSRLLLSALVTLCPPVGTWSQWGAHGHPGPEPSM